MKKSIGSSFKMLTTVCSVSLLAAALAACGGNNEEGSPTNSPANGPGNTGNEPTDISIMMIQFATEPMKADNPGIKVVEDYTNTKLEFTWVPTTAYNDKVSATLASGKMPDLMLVRQNKDSAMLNAQLSGAFWELTPYLKDYKNLSDINEIAVTNASIQGKLYGIPRERVIARYGMTYRKDWLDKVGLEPPQTIDDIYKMAKAFTEQDPDGNGQNDTYGIQEDKVMELLKQLRYTMAVQTAGA
jgi:putative aldouronate transport system substrate-binding protein